MADLCANNLEFSVSLHCIREIFGPADWPYVEGSSTLQDALKRHTAQIREGNAATGGKQPRTVIPSAAIADCEYQCGILLIAIIT